jgi:acyl carrier protein
MEELIRLGEEAGYVVEPSWVESYRGEYSLLFRPKGQKKYRTEIPNGAPEVELKKTASNPLRTRQVAYLTPRLREHLSERLPDYMVPSFFVLMEAWPLTSNGKLDRRSLPEPEAFRIRTEEYVPAANEVERQLAEIWSEVLALDVEEIGVHDNFFELGGHSLLATQVVSRVREVFEVELAVRAMFESPTITAFATDVSLIIWTLKHQVTQAQKGMERGTIQ